MEKVQIFTEKLLAASKRPASRSWTSFAATYAQLLLRILSRTSTALTSAQEARAGIDGQQGGRYLPSPKPSQVFLNRSLMGRGGHPSSQPAIPLLSRMSSSQQASPSAQPVAGSNPNVLPPVPSTSLIGNNGWQESHQNYAFHHQPQQHHGEPAPLGNIFGMPSPSMPPPTSSSMSWPGPDMDRNAGPPLMLENIMDQLLGASTFTQGADNESMREYEEGCMREPDRRLIPLSARSQNNILTRSSTEMPRTTAPRQCQMASRHGAFIHLSSSERLCYAFHTYFASHCTLYSCLHRRICNCNTLRGLSCIHTRLHLRALRRVDWKSVACFREQHFSLRCTRVWMSPV